MSYFDNNATTPLHAGAMQVLFDAHTESWANPSSPYRSSAQIRASMQKCRDKISSSLGVDPDHLIFTSGATEANNSVFANLSRQVDATARVLLSPYEHPSVSEAANYWFSNRVDLLRAQPNGAICLEELAKYLKNSPSPCLVSVMAASNESGVLQPWREIDSLCRDHGVPYHCDSTQLPGKEDLRAYQTAHFMLPVLTSLEGPKELVGW